MTVARRQQFEREIAEEDPEAIKKRRHLTEALASLQAQKTAGQILWTDYNSTVFAAVATARKKLPDHFFVRPGETVEASVDRVLADAARRSLAPVLDAAADARYLVHVVEDDPNALLACLSTERAKRLRTRKRSAAQQRRHDDNLASARETLAAAAASRTSALGNEDVAAQRQAEKALKSAQRSLAGLLLPDRPLPRLGQVLPHPAPTVSVTTAPSADFFISSQACARHLRDIAYAEDRDQAHLVSPVAIAYHLAPESEGAVEVYDRLRMKRTTIHPLHDAADDDDEAFALSVVVVGHDVSATEHDDGHGRLHVSYGAPGLAWITLASLAESGPMRDLQSYEDRFRQHNKTSALEWLDQQTASIASSVRAIVHGEQVLAAPPPAQPFEPSAEPGPMTRYRATKWSERGPARSDEIAGLETASSFYGPLEPQLDPRVKSAIAGRRVARVRRAAPRPLLSSSGRAKPVEPAEFDEDTYELKSTGSKPKKTDFEELQQQPMLSLAALAAEAAAQARAASTARVEPQPVGDGEGEDGGEDDERLDEDEDGLDEADIEPDAETPTGQSYDITKVLERAVVKRKLEHALAPIAQVSVQAGVTPIASLLRLYVPYAMSVHRFMAFFLNELVDFACDISTRSTEASATPGAQEIYDQLSKLGTGTVERFCRQALHCARGKETQVAEAVAGAAARAIESAPPPPQLLDAETELVNYICGKLKRDFGVSTKQQILQLVRSFAAKTIIGVLRSSERSPLLRQLSHPSNKQHLSKAITVMYMETPFGLHQPTARATAAALSPGLAKVSWWKTTPEEQRVEMLSEAFLDFHRIVSSFLLQRDRLCTEVRREQGPGEGNVSTLEYARQQRPGELLRLVHYLKLANGKSEGAGLAFKAEAAILPPKTLGKLLASVGEGEGDGFVQKALVWINSKPSALRTLASQESNALRGSSLTKTVTAGQTLEINKQELQYLQQDVAIASESLARLGTLDAINGQRVRLAQTLLSPSLLPSNRMPTGYFEVSPSTLYTSTFRLGEANVVEAQAKLGDSVDVATAPAATTISQLFIGANSSYYKDSVMTALPRTTTRWRKAPHGGTDEYIVSFFDPHSPRQRHESGHHTLYGDDSIATLSEPLAPLPSAEQEPRSQDLKKIYKTINLKSRRSFLEKLGYGTVDLGENGDASLPASVIESFTRRLTFIGVDMNYRFPIAICILKPTSFDHIEGECLHEVTNVLISTRKLDTAVARRKSTARETREDVARKLEAVEVESSTEIAQVFELSRLSVSESQSRDKLEAQLNSIVDRFADDLLNIAVAGHEMDHELVFVIGADLSHPTYGAGTVRWAPRLAKAMLRKSQARGLTCDVMLVDESLSSQTCCRPECLDEAGRRARTKEGQHTDSGAANHRILTCCVCGRTFNRDSAAGDVIAQKGWHWLAHGRDIVDVRKQYKQKKKQS